MTPGAAPFTADGITAQGQVRAKDVAILVGLAALTVAVHWFTGGRYGFHRDELATLDDARHLAWGYVAYPPVTPFFARLSLELFGTSLAGFRFFAALAEAVAVLLTGLMAGELGGDLRSQLLAATAALPFCLGGGALMQYVSFDYLFWVLTAYFALRMLKSGDPRWWLAIGGSVGMGMMAKYSILFFVVGLIVGLLATEARRLLATRWLWIGIAVASLIVLPNVIWQFRHDFITVDFLRYIHARDVRIGRTAGFLPDQLKLTLLAFPLWMAGLFYLLFSQSGKRYRTLGFMYLVPLVLFIVAKGRGYYLAAAYPMLYAAGSVWVLQRLAPLRRAWSVSILGVLWVALSVDVAVAAIFTLPIAPVASPWFQSAIKVNGDLREEFGWQELAETVAEVRDSVPAAERLRLGILAGNYGEAGAINLYGPQFGLPPAISGTNSFWERGYGNPAPETVIVLGMTRRFLDENFSSCELTGHTWNRAGVENEETRDHPDIYVCRGMRRSWPEFWKDFRHFG